MHPGSGVQRTGSWTHLKDPMRPRLHRSGAAVLCRKLRRFRRSLDAEVPVPIMPLAAAPLDALLVSPVDVRGAVQRDVELLDVVVSASVMLVTLRRRYLLCCTSHSRKHDEGLGHVAVDTVVPLAPAGPDSDTVLAPAEVSTAAPGRAVQRASAATRTQVRSATRPAAAAGWLMVAAVSPRTGRNAQRPPAATSSQVRPARRPRATAVPFLASRACRALHWRPARWPAPRLSLRDGRKPRRRRRS